MRALGSMLIAALVACRVGAQDDTSALHAEIDRLALKIEPQVIETRRHLHQNPELSNREVETARYVAARLRKLGLEVQTGVARHGVVAVLRGERPGVVVALRADMDALPVVEEVDLPFKSVKRASFDGKDVGVMHACGHDAHTAILLGVAEVLSANRERLPGTVKFIFQPAEEGAPAGEEGGAEVMVAEGVLTRDPAPTAIFGLHVFPQYEAGQIAWRAGGVLASSDNLDIVVRGRQTHGAYPWLGVDPIVIASQIILGLQTIPSRQMDLSKAPVIVTIGSIEGGVRRNIIADTVTLKGTLRSLDPQMRTDLQQRVRRTAENIAMSAGATVEVRIGDEHAYPVTYNDPDLTARLLPTLQRVAGPGVVPAIPCLGAEDFSFFAQKIPGLYLSLGIRTPGEPLTNWPANHSPRFRIDESALTLGVRSLANLAVDYNSLP